MAENVDNTLMLEILKEIRQEQQEMKKEQQEMRKEQQEMRKEQRDQRTLLLMTSEAVYKLHQYTEENLLAIKREFLDVRECMKAHKDGMEIMLKSELLGALTNFQSKIENYVEQRLAERAE